jgi:hypothetical protein
MRILQVSSAQELGGGETHFLELVDSLRNRDSKSSSPVVARATSRIDALHQFGRRLCCSTIAVDPQTFIRHSARTSRALHNHGSGGVGLSDEGCLHRHLLPVRRHALYHRVDAWLAPTSQILKLEPLSPKLSAVIPNWVDTGKFCIVPTPCTIP